jgi:hypothetical protein
VASRELPHLRIKQAPYVEIRTAAVRRAWLSASNMQLLNK